MIPDTLPLTYLSFRSLLFLFLIGTYVRLPQESGSPTPEE